MHCWIKFTSSNPSIDWWYDIFVFTSRSTWDFFVFVFVFVFMISVYSPQDPLEISFSSSFSPPLLFSFWRTSKSTKRQPGRSGKPLLKFKVLIIIEFNWIKLDWINFKSDEIEPLFQQKVQMMKPLGWDHHQVCIVGKALHYEVI